ncbi:PREDICTED: polygalacturonase inhibitor-like [Nelumbo nucifera]|nr:PREDICTED: polygalacturonase inhibitor-like [Nelumbo nucifera]
MDSHGSFSSYTSSFILLFLLVSSSLPSPALSDSTPRCNPANNGALLRIKESLNIHDYFADWNSSKECCDWSHVGCEAYSGEVFESIKSPFKIPAAIGDLSHLLALAFYDIPNLTGSIPSSFTKLQNPVSLTIRNTTLSGPIPEFLSQLKNLREMELPYN